MPLPSAVLLKVKTELTYSLQWLRYLDLSREGLPSEPKSTSFFQLPDIRPLWRLLPVQVRIMAYRPMLLVGREKYSSDVSWVQRVPFGFYIKHGSGTSVTNNEPLALRLVEKHTSIPSPKLVDHIAKDGYQWLVTTRMPGVPLGSVIQMLTYPELDTLAKDLRDCVAQLRRIQNPHNAICGLDGGPLYDYRFPRKVIGPFANEAAFNHCLSRAACGQAAPLERDHKVVFTHADLSTKNILVNAGRLSGIVDYDCAGFFPEYWEYVKCLFLDPGDFVTTWRDVVRDIFGDVYAEEYAADQTLRGFTSTY